MHLHIINKGLTILKSFFSLILYWILSFLFLSKKRPIHKERLTSDNIDKLNMYIPTLVEAAEGIT